MTRNKLVHQNNLWSFKGYFNIFILDEPEPVPEYDEGKIHYLDLRMLGP